MTGHVTWVLPNKIFYFVFLNFPSVRTIEIYDHVTINFCQRILTAYRGARQKTHDYYQLVGIVIPAAGRHHNARAYQWA